MEQASCTRPPFTNGEAMIITIYDQGEQVAVFIPDTDAPLWVLAEREEIRVMKK